MCEMCETARKIASDQGKCVSHIYQEKCETHSLKNSL